jgi:hypothetical protein
MTQELVLGVLLTGLVGLIWIMVLSIIDGDQSAPHSQNPGASTEQAKGEQLAHERLKERTIAA